MLTHASSKLSLSALPERQCCDEGSAPRWGECQNAASVSPLRSELYVASLFKRSKIARQGRSLHLQRISQRLDRERAAGANRREHRYLCCTQSRRSKCIVVCAGDDASSHAGLVAHAGVEEHLRQGCVGCFLSHVVHIHYMSALSMGIRVHLCLNRPHFAVLAGPQSVRRWLGAWLAPSLQSIADVEAVEKGAGIDGSTPGKPSATSAGDP